jgi:DNA invertase Pin-like site-specific DNA recombinase
MFYTVTGVGVYARISDDREGSGLGVARQVDDCTALAERRGWSVTDTYIDNDISAFRGKARPGYDRLLTDLKAGRIAGVVAWHPDRLHRSPVELEQFIDVIEATGAVVATVQAGDIDLATASGRMVARIVGAVARHESEHKGERQRRKHLELAQAGRPTGGGTRPFGFQPDRVQVDPAEAEIVREMATRVAAGESLRGIVVDLDARGITTPTGKLWRQTTARRMLLSPRVAGLREHRGEAVADAEWPAIVDRVTWERVRRVLLDPARVTRRSARSYLLKGIGRCGLCDARLVARPRSDKRRCYVCARGPGYEGCGKIRVLAEPLEDLVVDMVLAAIDGPGLAEARQRGLSDERVSLDVAGELGDVERRLDELAETFADGQVSRREWLTARGRLEARRDALNARLAASGPSPLATLAGDVYEAWERLSFDQRHAVVAAVVDRVIVGSAVRGRNRFDPDRVTLAWRV